MNTTAFAVLTVLYIIAVIYLGYLGWKKTRGSEDYMLAGRKLSPWVIGLSYGATFISVSAIIGFGGQSAKLGMGLVFLAMLNIAVGVLLAFIVFGGRTRKMAKKLNAVTFPDLLGKCYNSNVIHLITGITILVAMPLYAAAVLIGGSEFLSITLGLSYNSALVIFTVVTAVYVILGGLIAVMYTEAMQGVIMIGGMVVLFILTYALFPDAGGLTGINDALSNLTPPPDLISQGMTGWTSMPSFGSPIWYTLVTTMILGVGIGVLAQPQLVVRFMTAKDEKTLRRSIPVGGIFILLTAGIIYTVGPISNLWFNDTFGTDAWSYLHNVDQIIPAFIDGAFSDSLFGLFVPIFMIVLLSAAMSTLSSVFHSLGTSAGFDIYKSVQKIRHPDVEPKTSMRLTKYAMIVMIVLSLALAFCMPANIIARATAMYMGLCACALLPAFCMALFCKRPMAKPALWSILSGVVSWFIWTVFVHIAESSQLGICRAIFGVDALLGQPWQLIDPLLIALPISTAVMIIGWAICRNSSDVSLTSRELSGKE